MNYKRYACLYNLPSLVKSFTTIEIKSNFLGATGTGFIIPEAILQHAGQTTQVWDVIVKSKENQKNCGAVSLHPVNFIFVMN